MKLFHMLAKLNRNAGSVSGGVGAIPSQLFGLGGIGFVAEFGKFKHQAQAGIELQVE